ncbi:DNA -binding domain-containing protein [Sphingopyxis sp. MG]|uniref:DNA -binding domain-containing protein n=1 Tax=Sphingopyxis sp. MG TaxID=1866325 RepID=UPI001F373101|nr:DUF2285 domain-containing protein [Sphingopyxis sp. MG]
MLRLWQALSARPVTRDGRITPYQRRRIRLMMRAADGRANGATYRQIANALFGPERVAAVDRRAKRALTHFWCNKEG